MIAKKEIQSFVLSAAATNDAAAILFYFKDGTKRTVNLSPERFAAIVATLQATKTAYFYEDDQTKHLYITSALDAPGL